MILWSKALPPVVWCCWVGSQTVWTKEVVSSLECWRRETWEFKVLEVPNFYAVCCHPYLCASFIVLASRILLKICISLGFSVMMNTVSDFDFRVSRYLWSVIFRFFLFCFWFFFWFWDGDKLKCHSVIIFSFEICYPLVSLWWWTLWFRV